ncbi:SMI1/KNR4 family protein [Chryseobacterium sp. G0240]|uniref:SMI1/KNR4 family protein n=1 Tax=Chryseobacterium sp. G0240 TaxID=2487066 RepID=UPI000F450213|nr:SMI1/KNR4 family protein [Chryseobacterium sp. G0240]ROI02310.1 SMI1/KNR4 family protein [Chryseobacterium sp. G0240]
MNIQYLKKLEAAPKIGIRKIKGVSENTIKKVEQKFNIKFPLAYYEFLFLAGESCGALPIMDTADLETISSDWHYELLQEEIKETGLNNNIIRPFWLFAESNGCEQFYFFYLDEGNDPTVYLVDYSPTDDSKREVKSVNVNFSTFIEKKIDTAYKILKEGW